MPPSVRVLALSCISGISLMVDVAFISPSLSFSLKYQLWCNKVLHVSHTSSGVASNFESVEKRSSRQPSSLRSMLSGGSPASFAFELSIVEMFSSSRAEEAEAASI
jgi:hypothetical protein